MTLADTSRLIEELDPSDMDGIERALQLRGAIIALHASSSDPQTLADVQKAGERLREKLLSIRRDLLLESVRAIRVREYAALE